MLDTYERAVQEFLNVSKKSPKTYTLGVEMCMKENKRNNKSSWVCLIVTVYSIEREGFSGKTVPRRFLFLKQ